MAPARIVGDHPPREEMGCPSEVLNATEQQLIVPMLHIPGSGTERGNW